MDAVINRRRYSTDTATCLADNEYSSESGEFDGSTALFRTARGSYFAFQMTMWRGERDSITPLTPEEAEVLYERLPNRSVPFAVAFPDGWDEEA